MGPGEGLEQGWPSRVVLGSVKGLSPQVIQHRTQDTLGKECHLGLQWFPLAQAAPKRNRPLGTVVAIL